MRIVLFILGLYHGANGLVMLAAPSFWYGAVPGVTATGPANSHFIRDIGLAFLAAATALIWASRGGPRALIVVAVVFLGGHAAYHLVEMALHGSVSIRDLAVIVLPSFLPLTGLRRTA